MQQPESTDVTDVSPKDTVTGTADGSTTVTAADVFRNEVCRINHRENLLALISKQAQMYVYVWHVMCLLGVLDFRVEVFGTLVQYINYSIPQ